MQKIVLWGKEGGKKEKGIIYTAILKIDRDLSLKITFKKLTHIMDIFFIVTFTILLEVVLFKIRPLYSGSQF